MGDGPDVTSAVLRFKGTQAKDSELSAADKMLLAMVDRDFTRQGHLAAALGVSKQAVARAFGYPT